MPDIDPQDQMYLNRVQHLAAQPWIDPVIQLHQAAPGAVTPDLLRKVAQQNAKPKAFSQGVEIHDLDPSDPSLGKVVIDAATGEAVPKTAISKPDFKPRFVRPLDPQTGRPGPLAMTTSDRSAIPVKEHGPEAGDIDPSKYPKINLNGQEFMLLPKDLHLAGGKAPASDPLSEALKNTPAPAASGGWSILHPSTWGGGSSAAATPAPTAATPAPAPVAAAGPPLISSKADFDALPSGATYKEPDGKLYRKP